MGPPVHRSGAPSPVLTALEGRALGELGALQLAAPLLRRLPKGDGHPVLVLPGFTAGDPSTAPIRSILRRLGYRTYGWHLARNLGPTPEVIDGLFERLSAAFERDGRPVSLIGWSLGGIYARELARASSDRVRQVITLGSPFRMDSDGRSAVSGLYERLAPRPPTGRRPPTRESDRPTLEVPATAVYTRTDGVVRWWQCLEGEGPHRENIRVLGSHSGLGHNPAVVMAVADRLSQPADEWHPFQAPRWAASWFPQPTNWREPG